MTRPQLTEKAALDFARVQRWMQRENTVFVFGSNRVGIHGKGAARYAVALYGAKKGQGEGFAGRSYAIPTKATWKSAGLPLGEIAKHVRRFIEEARAHSELVYVVTRIGCGEAGYRDEQIAPLFAGAPENCSLPYGWRKIADGIGDD